MPSEESYMQSVSKRFGRMAAVLVVSSLLVTQGAFASSRQDDPLGLLGRLSRLKLVVVHVLSELGFPPG
jgi:hypothetical protein